MPPGSSSPTPYDVVLGGRSPAPPPTAAILGGLTGVKQRLMHPDPQQRIAALEAALGYPDGLTLVMGALSDRHERVQQRAYDLLRQSPDADVQQALRLHALSRAKRQLTQPDADARISALQTLIHHGHDGLNLVIHALRDPSEAVQREAYELLKDRPEHRVRKSLELFSAAGVNYMRLRALLINRKWHLADQETLHLMLKACGRADLQGFQPTHLAELPCEDLQIIDRLWTRYSKGRFGFSVQRTLWREIYTLYWNKSDMWSIFGDRVGWRVNHLLNLNHWRRYNELQFDLRAPIGHLPFLGDAFGIFTIEAIAHRLSHCQRQP
jgi:hypothetical protein